LDRIGTQKRKVRGHGKLDRVLHASCANLSRRAHHHVVNVAPVRLRVERPRLDPGEVEKIVHEAGEPSRLVAYDRDELDPIVRADAIVAQPTRRGCDARQR
jgi:hypothetical protein